MDEFSRQIESMGGKTVLKEYFDHGTTDFYTLLTRARAAKPDGIFVAAETQDGSHRRQADEGAGAEQQGVRRGQLGHGRLREADRRRLGRHHAAVPYAATIRYAGQQSLRRRLQGRVQGSARQIFRRRLQRAEHHLLDAIQRAGAADPAARSAPPWKTDYKGPNGDFRFDAKHQAYGFDAVLGSSSRAGRRRSYRRPRCRALTPRHRH